MSKTEVNIPRIIIAGVSGDSGKTLVSCGLLSSFKKRGMKIAAFKKGPDYIDSAWLSLASNTKARNLDSYLFGKSKLLQSFCIHSESKHIALIEGNRGLYDGFDEKGTHSTAELAKLLNAPVIIVIPANKITRTVAAILLGLKILDRKVNIQGVIINQTAGKRHSDIIKKSVENDTGLKVFGVLPKYSDKMLLPSRHLGLVTPVELNSANQIIMTAEKLIEDNIDVDSIIAVAQESPALNLNFKKENKAKALRVKIGYFHDRVFSFYYHENLEALEANGAELVQISSISDKKLPDIDALYIGGGFPESNIGLLLSNRELMSSVKDASESGMPIYAECGGLIYLSDVLEFSNKSFQMSNVFPVKIGMHKKPQGHGYIEALVDKHNPFLPQNTTIRGHEFHYTKIIDSTSEIKTCLNMKRGIGAINNRDGLIYKNTFASYSHIHSLSNSKWAECMINEAVKYKVKNT